MEQDITYPEHADQPPDHHDEHFQLTHRDLPIPIGADHKGRFAKHMDRFTHNLTETRESSISYRGMSAGLMAAYVVLRRTVEHQGERIVRHVVMEVKPHVSHVTEIISGKPQQVKRIAYALRHLRRHEEGQPLVADEEPHMIVEASARMGEPGAENGQLDFSIGETGVVAMEAIDGTVVQAMAVYSSNEADLAHLPVK
jgi:hypothetical protein